MPIPPTPSTPVRSPRAPAGASVPGPGGTAPEVAPAPAGAPGWAPSDDAHRGFVDAHQPGAPAPAGGGSVLAVRTGAVAVTRAARLADPAVQAALRQVPGMAALRLEMLSLRDIELGTWSATHTAQMIKDRAVTVTEVVSSAIRRAQAGEHLGMIDHALFDEALAQAAAMDAAGDFDTPFAGVPMTIKANAKLKGAPTSYGSRAVPRVPAKENAPHVQDYLDLGIIPIFVSTSSEFGFNGVTEPEGGRPTVNPHNPAYTAGGSSGGSAVAVAAGVVPFGHGTDGGGSCRVPASLTGILGIKPTRRRLTLLDGAEDLPVLINTPGVMARDVRDMAKAMQYLDRGQAHGMAPLGLVDGPPTRPLKIGYYVDPIGGQAEPEVKKATLEMVDRLRAMGHVVEEIEQPYTQQFVNDFLNVYRLIAWGTRRKLRKNDATDHTKLETFSQGLADLSLLEVARAKLLSATRLNHKHDDKYDEVFEEFDLMLNPTVTGDAPRLGELSADHTYAEMIEGLLDLVGYTPLQNASGNPAISVPAGWSDAGLPIGLQFSANDGADALLLQIAHALADEGDA